jgi:hypothetical protein
LILTLGSALPLTAAPKTPSNRKTGGACPPGASGRREGGWNLVGSSEQYATVRWFNRETPSD